MRRKTEMYECPKCGEIGARIEDYDFDVDCLWIKCYCAACEESWTEYAILTYDGYSYDGKSYDAEGKECLDI